MIDVEVAITFEPLHSTFLSKTKEAIGVLKVSKAIVSNFEQPKASVIITKTVSFAFTVTVAVSQVEQAIGLPCVLVQCHEEI